jgi:L-amino acid N-acyltransferase YncA
LSARQSVRGSSLSAGKILGYAHVSKHRSKNAYDWSADVTVYTDHAHHRQGGAQLLYDELLGKLSDIGYCNAYAGITLPNAPSIAFHESRGFSHLGTYERVGFKHGAWHSVGWWHKNLQPGTAAPEKLRVTLQDLTAKNRGDFTFSCSAARMDVDAIHAMLSRSHWAASRNRETVAKSVASSLCFGIFQGQRQIAIARVVTDSCTFAYLCDVFVHEDFRGQGLSKWLMDEIMAYPALSNLRRFILATLDAHSLNERYGFVPFNADEQRRFMGIRKDGV